MFAVAYVSKQKNLFCERDLIALASAANTRNSQLDITGYLFHKGEYFFQYLEGEQETLSKLMSSIKRDPRHCISRIVEIGEIEERSFAAWNMRYVTPDELDEINLEDIAQDVILRMTRPTFSEDMVKDRIVAIVRRIAELQTGRPEIGSAQPN